MMEKTKLKDLYFSFMRIGLFTFGGGLAMIPMLEKEIVEKHNWCDEEELMNYYAIGQSTPGIIAVNVATFVGYKHKGVLGGVIATLGIITPSLLIITLIATFIENFAEYPIVQKALKGLGIGVCAIIIPSLIKLFKSSIKNIYLAIIAIISFILVEFFKVPIIILVLAGILLGILLGIKEKKNDLS